MCVPIPIFKVLSKKMSALLNCSISCMVLSIWAIVQLTFMGICYKMESPVLIEDAEAHEYNSYDDYLKHTKQNYHILALNCWIVAGTYVVTLLISIGGIFYARKKARESDLLRDDDEHFCKPPPPPVKKMNVGKKK